MTANMSWGPLHRRLSRAPWISLGVSMSVVESAGGGAGAELVHTRERVEEGECQLTGHTHTPIKIFIFKKIKKLLFCSSQARRWGGDNGRWRGRGGGDCFNSI